MDYKSARTLKNEISASLLNRKKAKVKLYAMSAEFHSESVRLSVDVKTSVNGVGIGERNNGEKFIKILTRNSNPLDHSRIIKNFGLPKDEVLIQNVGSIRFKSIKTQRPPFPGISVGHYKVTAGTLGCFVIDSKKKIYILSNNHVLANCDDCYYDDPIIQPGTLDGGSRNKHKIASLKYLVPLERSNPNAMDAAIAEIDDGLSIERTLNNMRKVTGTIVPTARLNVEKWGRTTGHTKGSISSTEIDIKIDYDGFELDFQDQFEIVGKKISGKTTMFCDGGDSGSLIVLGESEKAVGLLFAGADDGTTYASPIKQVLKTFAVKII